MTTNQRKYTIFAVLGALTIALDQWTKVLARASLRGLDFRHPKTVVQGFFDLRYSENTGVAFGMMQSMNGGRILLTVLALAAFALVLYYVHKADSQNSRLHVALGLIGGGAIGNLIDRIAFGRVSDFIVWHIGEHEWPAFNIADAALVIGVGLIALDMFPKRSQPSAPPVR